MGLAQGPRSYMGEAPSWTDTTCCKKIRPPRLMAQRGHKVAKYALDCCGVALTMR